jgi:tetratricopeptide (TPR) repeat protein
LLWVLEDEMKNLLIGFLLILAFSEAQTDVEQLLTDGQTLMEEAMTAYPKAYPDQPLWQQAIARGKEAVELAPNEPEPVRFLAEVYSRSNWFGPAYQTWEQYLATGNTLGADDIPLFRSVTFELAYGAYDAKNYDLALRYFQRIIDLVPYDKDAYVWAGRVLIETNRPEEAIGYWQTAVERDPTDDRSQYFLVLAQDQSRWGVDAANAFREGVTFYEEGDLVSARERFNRAVSRNEMYSEAWAWLGRVEFEQGNYQNAITYYGEASMLEPQNETYSYFLTESQRRAGSN